jgi:NADH:ubiquinone oxidoreductase subunit E
LSDANEAMRERIRQTLNNQQRPTVTVLSSLLATQDRLGYLPNEAIEEVAAFTEASVNDVWGVASFYTNFRFTPPAEHLVEVCWGPTCHLKGASMVIKTLLEECGLDGEGDTENRKVTLKYNTCLGACSQAPVMSVDHRLLGHIAADSARGIVGDLLNEDA